MPDRREEILWTKLHPTTTSVTINGAKDAMDEYMKECCLELLEYIGEKCICFDYDEYGQLQFQLKGGGHWVTKEQLFQNYL